MRILQKKYDPNWKNLHPILFWNSKENILYKYFDPDLLNQIRVRRIRLLWENRFRIPNLTGIGFRNHLESDPQLWFRDKKKIENVLDWPAIVKKYYAVVKNTPAAPWAPTAPQNETGSCQPKIT